RMAVLEDGILSRHIESEVGALDLDEKVDSAAIEETYRAHAEAVCPDCAEVDMAEVLDECGITECTDCGTLHNRDDSTKAMDGSAEVLCPDCECEMHDSLEEAHGVVEDILGWELRTGRGIKIRTDDGGVQRWDGMKWSPSTPLPGEFCINEVKWWTGRCGSRRAHEHASCARCVCTPGKRKRHGQVHQHGSQARGQSRADPALPEEAVPAHQAGSRGHPQVLLPRKPRPRTGQGSR